MRVLYINLDSAKDRRQFMEAQAAALGLTLERSRATVPSDIPPELLALYTPSWQRPMTPNEIALFLSHRALWQVAADSAEGAVILEDDAVLSPRFGRVIASLPTGFDVINLEDFERLKFFARTPAAPIDGGSVTPTLRDRSGAAGYYLSPQGARRLLDLSNIRAAPADAFIYGEAHLRGAQVEPAVVKQERFLTARGIDVGIVTTTSVHAARRQLPLRLENRGYFARRVAEQFRLAGWQFRRLVDTDYRYSRFDDEELRPYLPVKLEAAE